MRFGVDGDVMRLFAIDTQGGEFAALHAAGIDGVHAEAGKASEC